MRARDIRLPPHSIGPRIPGATLHRIREARSMLVVDDCLILQERQGVKHDPAVLVLVAGDLRQESRYLI